MATEIVHRSCPTCEASCGLRCEIDRESRQVLRIEGDPEDPRSRGYLCPKAYAMKEIFEDPERLRVPIRKREDGSWEEISWDEALDLAARRLADIRDTHGPNANGYYIGNPTGHNVGAQLYIPPLIAGLGTQRSFSAGTMDQHPQNVALHTMLGEGWMFPIPDIDRCEYFVCMGGNPLVSQGSLMSAPNAKRRLQSIEQRGGKTVVIDPRRTETAEVCSEHIFIKPGSDALWLMAVCQVKCAKSRSRASAFIMCRRISSPSSRTRRSASGRAKAGCPFSTTPFSPTVSLRWATRSPTMDSPGTRFQITPRPVKNVNTI